MPTKEKQNMGKYAAELIDTFVLVFGGCGAAVPAHGCAPRFEPCVSPGEGTSSHPA